MALARALVLEPAVLLLDEPLGALDAKLRHSLRAELAGLQREIGITFVFVTHDQEEALEMSNRLVVMDGGRIMQLGCPEEVYSEPLTEFVADFLGVTNLLDIECLSDTGSTRTIRYGEFTLEAQAPAGHDAGAGRAVIRPECVELAEAGLTGANRLPGMVDRTVFLGSTTQVMVRLPQGAVLQSLTTNSAASHAYSAGQPVTVCLPSESLRVLAASTDTRSWPTPSRPDLGSAPVGQRLERRLVTSATPCLQHQQREDQREECSDQQDRRQRVQRRRRRGSDGVVQHDGHGRVRRVSEQELADNEVVERRREGDHG